MFKINRKIEIDAGHRIKHHDSKCRNIHGHRYVVEMTLNAESLNEQGSQENMLMDFSFMKDILNEIIDENCDHAFILDSEDSYLSKLFNANAECGMVTESGQAVLFHNDEGMKLYIVPFSPTAEALSKHWYELLLNKLSMLDLPLAIKVNSVKVYETPNCWASYP